MARLSEEELNSVRGIHYADGGTYAPWYYVRQDLIDRINKEWEGKYGPYKEEPAIEPRT